MQKSRTTRSLFVTAAVGLLAAVPATAAHNPHIIAVSGGATPPAVTVVVRNCNSLDVQVFAVTEAGKRFELGKVNRDSQRRFALPSGIVENNAEYRLKVYSLAGGLPASVVDKHVAAVKTQPLSPTASNEIVLTVEDPLDASHIDHGATASS